jgi:hypothetical protein
VKLYHIGFTLIPVLVDDFDNETEAGKYVADKYEKGLDEDTNGFLLVNLLGELFWYCSPIENGFAWERAVGDTT